MRVKSPPLGNKFSSSGRSTQRENTSQLICRGGAQVRPSEIDDDAELLLVSGQMAELWPVST